MARSTPGLPSCPALTLDLSTPGLCCRTGGGGAKSESLGKDESPASDCVLSVMTRRPAADATCC